MNISLTDILITIFLLLVYKLLQKRSVKLHKVDKFTEKKLIVINKPKLDISKLQIKENNIKMNLTKNNNSFDLNKVLTYKIVRPVKNWIKMNDKKFNLNKITISKSKFVYDNKKVQLEIQLHFTESLKIIIPIIESKDNNYLQLFRINNLDTYQSGKYLIKNLPRKVQGVNNKSIVFNIWFYPLVKFIESNKTLYFEKSNTFYTNYYNLNLKDINNINECL